MTTRNFRGKPRRVGRGRYYQRRLVCAFCVDSSLTIDYKNTAILRRFLSDRARIEPRRRTGACAKHQRIISKAIKRARHLALLPFSPGHVFPVVQSAQQQPKVQEEANVAQEGVALEQPEVGVALEQSEEVVALEQSEEVVALEQPQEPPEDSVTEEDKLEGQLQEPVQEASDDQVDDDQAPKQDSTQ